MKRILITGMMIVCCGWLVACSSASTDDENQQIPQKSSLETKRVEFRSLDEGITVFAFREQNNEYLYETTFSEGWVDETDGSKSLTSELVSGRYRFVFASSYGETLNLESAPTQTTTFDQLKFTLQQNSDLPGYYLPADELFLQDTPANASQVYEIYSPTIVRCTLKRAVSRIDVTIKRGYQNGTDDDGQPIMVEVPYADPDNDKLLDYIENIAITATGIGNKVGINGGEGSVAMSVTTNDLSIIDGGFAFLEGPNFIPTGSQLTIDVKLTPVEGNGFPNLSKSGITVSPQRNEKVNVTLWVDKLWPEIIVNVDTSEITETTDGDSGMWD